MSIRKLRVLLLLTSLWVWFTASESDAFGQDRVCDPPSVKAPPNVARRLVDREVKLGIIEPYERPKFLHRRGGVSGLFCGDTLDLNKHGKSVLEITVSDADDALRFRGASNRPVWVFRRMRQGYQLLLEASAEGAGGGGSGVDVLKTSTRGYRDIKTRTLESAVEHDTIIYKFDGRRYQPRVCMTETYVDDKPGGSRVKYKRWNCKELQY